jgi:hypothetical protein
MARFALFLAFVSVLATSLVDAAPLSNRQNGRQRQGGGRNGGQTGNGNGNGNGAANLPATDVATDGSMILEDQVVIKYVI